MQNLEAFLIQIKDSGRILGIDFGTKKIGLAVTDIERKFAFPHSIFYRKNFEYDKKFFLNFLNEMEIIGIIIGIAIYNNRISNKKFFLQTKYFIESLCEIKKIPYCFYDENFTSVFANDILYERGVKYKKIEKVEDAIAAALLLEDALSIEIL